MRDNEIRDTFANIMQGVEVEPNPQLLQGEYFIPKTTNTDENARD